MGDHRLTWAVERRTWSREQAGEAALVVATTVEDACRRCFPRSAGYATSRARLAGMVDGVRLSIHRGTFHAVVSTQSFVERRARGEGCAIRLVAAARDDRPAPAALARIGRPAALGLTLAALVALTAALLGADGLWGYFRLSLLMSFLIMMTPAIAWLGALQPEPAPPPEAPWPALPPGEDQERWAQLIARLDAPQALVASDRGLPFRRTS